MFSKIPPAPFPKKCTGVNLGINALVNHMSGVNVKLNIDAFELCFFDTNPFDVEPRGMRIGVEKCVDVELAIEKWEKGAPLPDPFVDGILHLPGSYWCVSKVNFQTGVINGRICTKTSGSRGKFLFVLESVGVEMGGKGGATEGEEEERILGMMEFAQSTVTR